MTRVKSQDHPRSRQRAASYRAEFNQEIEQRIAQLRDRISQVRDLTVDGFPYRDSERVRLELQIRQAIRQAFGDGSPEFQKHQYFRLRIGNEAEIQSTVALLENLIAGLEKQKFEIPEDNARGARSPDAPPTPAESNSSPPAAPPAFGAVESAPAAPIAPSPGDPAPTFVGHSPPSNGQPATSSGDDQMVTRLPRQHGTDTLPRETGSDTRNAGDLPPLDAIRTLCTGFHAVARQLRQRHEDRPTLDVEDEHDVQDLLHALLRLQFDDIRTEHWVPSYAGGAARTTFLLVPERIALVIKRTRPGLGGREITAQLEIDAQRYSGRPDCDRLFCFVYDPEGRIANPREFETGLSCGSEIGAPVVQISP